jgi:hypothetical protein
MKFAFLFPLLINLPHFLLQTVPYLHHQSFGEAKGPVSKTSSCQFRVANPAHLGSRNLWLSDLGESGSLFVSLKLEWVGKIVRLSFFDVIVDVWKIQI